MDLRAAIGHVAIAAALGGLFAAVTPAKWLAASLWMSAAMLLNGAVATLEDAQPGGFDNPDGATPLMTRWAAAKLMLSSLAFAAAVAGLGLWIQFA